jgi:hypothetical protein
VVGAVAAVVLDAAFLFLLAVFGDSGGITIVTTWPDGCAGGVGSTGPCVAVEVVSTPGTPVGGSARTATGAAQRVARHRATVKRAGQCIGDIIRHSPCSCKNVHDVRWLTC